MISNPTPLISFFTWTTFMEILGPPKIFGWRLLWFFFGLILPITSTIWVVKDAAATATATATATASVLQWEPQVYVCDDKNNFFYFTLRKTLSTMYGFRKLAHHITLFPIRKPKKPPVKTPRIISSHSLSFRKTRTIIPPKNMTYNYFGPIQFLTFHKRMTKIQFSLKQAPGAKGKEN